MDFVLKPPSRACMLDLPPKRFYVTNLPGSWHGTIREMKDIMFGYFLDFCLIDNVSIKKSDGKFYGVIDVLRRRDGQSLLNALLVGNHLYVKNANQYIKVDTSLELPPTRAYSREEMLAIRKSSCRVNITVVTSAPIE